VGGFFEALRMLAVIAAAFFAGTTQHVATGCVQTSAVIQAGAAQQIQLQLGPGKFALIGTPPECPAG
jgi:hypothetical protein